MNFKSPKIKTLLGLAGILFLTAGILTGSAILQTRQNIREFAAAATNLFFVPSTQNVSQNDNMNFVVKMDTGPNSVTGVDFLLNFDPNSMQVTSIEQGSGLSDFSNTITSSFDNAAGTISYAGFTLDKKLAVNGSDIEVLKINATVNSETSPGTFTVTFDPSTAISATNESRNVLTTAGPATFNVIPASTPVPTNAPGEPNSCGGTCGSNLNCAGNLFCYQGYCRNPDCSFANDCDCSTATSTPTTAPTNPPAQTRRSTRTAIPEPTEIPVTETVVEVPPEEPMPTENNFWENTYNSEQVQEPTQDIPTLAPVALPESKNDNLLPWIIGALMIGAITLVLIAIGVYKHNHVSNKSKPPVIKI